MTRLVEMVLGAGKSTLLGDLRIRSSKKVHFIDEPLSLWSTLKNSDGKNLLETFYSGNIFSSSFYCRISLSFEIDRQRWSFTFQSCALMSRYKNIDQSVKSVVLTESDRNVFVSERCLDTDYECFTKMLHHDGAISQLELSIYEMYFNQLKSMTIPLQGIIHVNTSPEKCLARIRSRNRKGEDAITLEYLTALDHWTSKWINSVTIPVLKVDDTTQTTQVDAFLSNILS